MSIFFQLMFHLKTSLISKGNDESPHHLPLIPSIFGAAKQRGCRTSDGLSPQNVCFWLQPKLQHQSGIAPKSGRDCAPPKEIISCNLRDCCWLVISCDCETSMGRARIDGNRSHRMLDYFSSEL